LFAPRCEVRRANLEGDSGRCEWRELFRLSEAMGLTEREGENGDAQTTKSVEDMAAAAYTNAGSKIESALAGYAARIAG